VDELGWVATGNDVNPVVMILVRCTANRIVLASRLQLQFITT
jgi:hypothetical protein